MIIQFFHLFRLFHLLLVLSFENRKLDLLSRPFKRHSLFRRLISLGRSRAPVAGGGQGEGLCVWRPVALRSRAGASQVNLGKNNSRSLCLTPSTRGERTQGEVCMII